MPEPAPDDDKKLLALTLGQCLESDERSVRSMARDIETEARAKGTEHPEKLTVNELLQHPSQLICILADALFQTLKALALEKQQHAKPTWRVRI
jgi:hypothetical protein